ncbi:hypothetical protein O6H91_20G035500 [Diphasiastrum complanatum]|uniref:Uncharacterized protein n=1 Tax=Diphasiastrum complanatum TaxID=34168 RepID=A0ACC2APD1_DIPCM|nr:hypothetical protein O6H91_20G035500 [Diphasiastrum complanatum]
MGSNCTTAHASVPIYLNIYDLTPLNGYMYWFGVGIFHSGIEAHGVEYGFGAHDYPTSGVFEVEPRKCPGFIFRRAILLGTTDLSASKFREFIEHLAAKYNGNSYHLIVKNCNHFTNDVSIQLIGNGIPGWVNRLARLGWLCNCVLPESFQVKAVQPAPIYDLSEENEHETGSSQNHRGTENEQDQWLLMAATGDIQLSIHDRAGDVVIKHFESVKLECS